MAHIWLGKEEDPEGFKIIYINPVKGYGVFTTKEFTKGDFLLEYVGETIHEEEALEREKNYAKRQKNAKYSRCYTFFYKHNEKHFCIDATNTTGRAGSLVNDGILIKHFNCKMKKITLNGKVHLALFATRQIDSGSELLYDYGEDNLWWRKSCEQNNENLETLGSDVQGKTEGNDKMPSGDDSDVSEVLVDMETEHGNDSDVGKRSPDVDVPADTSDEVKDSDCDVQGKTEGTEKMLSGDDSDVSEVLVDMETEHGNDSDVGKRSPDVDVPADTSDEVKDSDCDVQGKTEGTEKMLSGDDSDVSEVLVDMETEHGNDSDVAQVSHGKKGERVYDKRQACYYCGQLFAKISEHLENKHKDQMEVANVLALKKGSQSRALAWKKLRNMGNFQHNVLILSTPTHDQADDDLQLIVDRRPKNAINMDEFLPCSFCLAFFRKRDLWRHAKKCPLNIAGSSEEETRVQLSSKLLLESSMARNNSKVDQNFLTVVAGMKNDEVLDCIKSDNGLRLLGGSMIQKVGKSRLANVRQKLRELGRLLIELRKTTPVNGTSLQNFDDVLKPQNFDRVTEVVWNIAGTTPSGEEAFTQRGLPKYEKPSLALKLGHSLKRMAEMKRGCAIRCGDEVARKEAENYITLHTTEWNGKISSHASQTLSERRHNDPNLLPLTEDVIKLRRYLLDEQQRLIPQLRSAPSVSVWRTLAQVALTRVTVFNKRRGGETGQILLETYQNRINWNEAGNAEVLGTLQPLEKKLLERLQLVEIVGKRDRKVPVILTEDMVSTIDALNEVRKDILLHAENKYLFAAPTTKDGFLKGWDALHFTTQNAGLAKPQLITSTNMRKYVATVSQT
ncbi:uncharacterized protein LOC132562769 [Ylistrum balloti]|uniref:uncharacterized protein LOC132562769 n=1 Tax=Ylistrum balloti TaxID=509963 RepID=UPI002905A9E3|nr:uncharacterized protein LOC132562769 [Ylistrum balloti]